MRLVDPLLFASLEYLFNIDISWRKNRLLWLLLVLQNSRDADVDAALVSQNLAHPLPHGTARTIKNPFGTLHDGTNAARLLKHAVCALLTAAKFLAC